MNTTYPPNAQRDALFRAVRAMNSNWTVFGRDIADEGWMLVLDPSDAERVAEKAREFTSHKVVIRSGSMASVVILD